MMTRREFETVSKELRADLARLAGRFISATGGPDEGEDIVQEALIALWELSEKGYPIRDAKALAIRITKNICVSRYRKRKLETLPVKDDSFPGGFRAEERVEAADNTRIKKAVFSELSKSEAEIMTLKTERDLTLDEIAKETGRPKASVKVLISNARKKIREKLKRI